jgi:hypothetical protein
MPMVKRSRVWSVVFVAMLVASACSDGTPADRSATSPSVASLRPSATPTDPLAERMTPAMAAEVLDFEAPAVGGGVLRGLDYSGRDVVLWFFAPW